MDQENPSLEEIFGKKTARQAEFGAYIAQLGGASTSAYRRFTESKAPLRWLLEGQEESPGDSSENTSPDK